ncbi:MAG TPA: GlsB/YeaQ/YmgE family stress response membrane protein [Candidatus Paceibacterota bacterium]|nr:GlsB/YeaQ/YmgE family stress response membrane protein [Candidatus Paceibacterota bacterium]
MRTDETQGIGMDILLGIIGAVIGGFVMSLVGQPEVTGFNLYSLVVAVVGAVILIWLGRALRSTT